ncbi:DUF547 domain-containing protein [Piscinibacter sakaiensis]|uniref:DUF547 domain-containing protein n=1 Tax=Piscinibacter sakaiensis TaxID=1547922 RepID=UPI003AB07E20
MTKKMLMPSEPLAGRLLQQARRWLARSLLLLMPLLLLAHAPAARAEFDHGHAAWDALVKRHVKWLPDNKQSRVDYAAFKADRKALQQVLGSYSSVSRQSFDGWSRPQQMAFLINAYNAFTVELILSRYPDLKSIKDLGSLFQSPWKKEFFTLLGEKRHLDWIEHERLRPDYKDYRVHGAVNCASIGCPALRDEAFVATRLDAQLDDGMTRFLADRTRNRVRDGRLEVSMIFKWFREDFEQGHLGVRRLEDLFARHAKQLSDDAAVQARLQARALPIDFLDYDWSLNALGR